MQASSSKKLGKRPLHRNVVETTDATTQDGNPVAPLATGTSRRRDPHPPQPMQKRVLPARHRRGGRGIGNCAADTLILKAEKKAKGARPVIPLSTAFFITTNPKLMPASSETDLVDLESYFDRPEVKAAYLAQKAIQVPEFSPLPDDAVGARLRARAPEESEETQDLAYTKRHQRFDTFEKRTRRREKEKLVHEHYQIRQRIDQLKGLEASELGSGDPRRKEFLVSAITLNSKYTVLFPSEPRRSKNGKKREGVRAGTTTGEDADTGSETPTSTRPLAKERTNHTKSASQQPSPVPPPVPAPAVTVALEVNEVPHAPRSPEYIAPNAFNAPLKRESGRVAAKAEAKPTSRKRPLPETETAPEPAVTAVPPRKRLRTDPRATPMEAPPHTQSVLLQIAMRKAAQPRARQTSRVIHAFGFGIPAAIEEEVYYELPENVISQSCLEEQYRKKLGSVSDGDPPGMDGSAEEYGYWSKEPGYLNGAPGLNGLSTIRETSEGPMDVDGAPGHS